MHSAMALAMGASGPVARGEGVTFWTIPLLVVFLFVQNRVDARDPKLADSPTHAAPSLPFDEGYDV